MSEIVARKTRKLGPKWPNQASRRTSQIDGQTRYEIAWTGPDGEGLASLTVTKGKRLAVGSINDGLKLTPDRARIELVGGSVVADGEGDSARAAYRAADRDLRLFRQDPADLLRKVAFRDEQVRQRDALIESLRAEIKRLEEENTALKAQLDKACHATIDGFDINHWYRQASAAEARAQQWKNTVDRMIAEQGGATYKPVTVDATAEAAQEAATS